jgi:prepilin-type processing-associated H-X9-DG protein
LLTVTGERCAVFAARGNGESTAGFGDGHVKLGSGAREKRPVLWQLGFVSTAVYVVLLPLPWQNYGKITIRVKFFLLRGILSGIQMLWADPAKSISLVKPTGI